MKLINITYRLYYVALALTAMVATAACSSKEIDVQPEEPTYTISLQINTNGIFTRAEGPTWGDEYNKEEGTPFDRTLKSVDLFLLDKESYALTRLYALRKPGEARHIYECSVTKDTPGVEIDEESRTATFSGSIMVVANVGTPWYDASDWHTDMIPFSVNYGTNNDWSIPMWGVRKYDGVKLESNVTKDLGDIDMLRAVAKIDINLHDAIKDEFEIESVTMTDDAPRFYRAGVGIPSGAWSVDETKSLKLEDCFNPVAGGMIDRIESPVFNIAPSGVEAYTYVAESSTEIDKPFEFTLKLKSKHDDRPAVTGTLKLSRYKDGAVANSGTYTRVIRNHVYEFTVNLTELGFITSVKKWVLGGTVHIDMEEIEDE